MSLPLPEQYRLDPPTMEEITNNAVLGTDLTGDLLTQTVICYNCQLGECGGSEWFTGKDGSMWACDHECHPDAVREEMERSPIQ